MDNKELYNVRLLFFADHIASIKYHLAHELIDGVELVTVSEKVRIHYKVQYRHWIFDELPGVFEDWYYDEMTGTALFPGCDPKNGAAAAVIDYFGLNEDEFCHCFDIEGLQQARFGGAGLNNESSGSDFAFNIVELVKYRRKAADEG